METRLATVDDAAGIAKVNVLGWQQAYKAFMPAEFLRQLSVESRTTGWRRGLTDNVISVLVTTDRSGQVVGFCSFGRTRDADASAGTAEILTAYVLPGNWHQGIGKNLVNRALERCKATGYAKVTLWVLERNEPARAFYESVGFKLEAGASKMSELGGTTLVELRYAYAIDDAVLAGRT